MFRKYRPLTPRSATLWCAAMLTLLTASCDFDSICDCESDSGSVQVALTLRLDEPASRAANDGWSDYDPAEPGTQKENYIDREDLQVGLYDESGRLLGQVEQIACLPTDASGTTYTFNGSWMPQSAEELAQVARVMVLANCGNPDFGARGLEQLAFDRTAANIPLWGVAGMSGNLQPGQAADLGQIDLLRAVAKVEVKLNDELASLGYALGNVTLHHYNERGYCLPAGYADVDETRELTFANTFHPLASVAAAPVALSLTAGTAAGVPKFVYVTEYDNTASPADAAYLLVELERAGEVEDVYKLPFCEYSEEGAPTDQVYDLVRNHLYRFTLRKSGVTLGASLEVRKWNEVTHSDIVM